MGLNFRSNNAQANREKLLANIETDSEWSLSGFNYHLFKDLIVLFRNDTCRLNVAQAISAEFDYVFFVKSDRTTQCFRVHVQ